LSKFILRSHLWPNSKQCLFATLGLTGISVYFILEQIAVDYFIGIRLDLISFSFHRGFLEYGDLSLNTKTRLVGHDKMYMNHKG
jgi:hypothetical protein